jgi:ubiquinone/menaquinone biosynthesis C-methylase UbiE
LRQYRQENVIASLAKHPAKNILEIGCGPQPLFREYDDFEKMVAVEPLKEFFTEALAQAGNDPRIRLINDRFENIADQLTSEHFDFIIVGGFLHEIDNPVEVLKAIKKVCSIETMIHSFVPNAHSFHRLLAFEMGLIDTIYQKSGHDEMFERTEVYNIETFRELFLSTGFQVKELGTYFIKTYTHDQMHAMLACNVVNKAVIDGLNRMTKYFPANGAEIYIGCMLDASEKATDKL